MEIRGALKAMSKLNGLKLLGGDSRGLLIDKVRTYVQLASHADILVGMKPFKRLAYVRAT